MVRLLLLLYLTCLSSKTLGTAYDECLKITFDRKSVEKLTKEFEDFLTKQNKNDYETKLYKNLPRLNDLEPKRYRFKVEDEINVIKQAIKHCTKCFSIRLGFDERSFTCFRKQRLPFLAYIQTGNRLLYCKSTSCKICEIVNINPKSIKSDKHYLQYNILDNVNSKESRRTNGYKKFGYGRLKESYQIKFAKHVETVKNDEKVKYIRLHTEPCFKLLDQDLRHHRVERFTNGLVSHYGSYLLEFEVEDFYSSEQCQNVSNDDFSSNSLTILRNNFPLYESYMPDIVTIEDHRRFISNMKCVIEVIPVMLWMIEENYFRYFEMELQDNEKLNMLEKDLRYLYARNYAALACQNKLLTKECDHLMLSLSDFVIRLCTSAKDNNLGLNKIEITILQSIINRTQKVSNAILAKKDADCCYMYEKYIMMLQDFVKDLNNPKKIVCLVLECFVEFFNKAVRSYTFMSKNQEKSIKQFLCISGEEPLDENDKYFAQMSIAKNVFVDDDMSQIATKKDVENSNIDLMSKYKDTIKIIDDLTKKVMMKCSLDKSRVNNKEKAEKIICKFAKMFLTIVEHKPTGDKQNKMEFDDKKLYLMSQANILFTLLHHQPIHETIRDITQKCRNSLSLIDPNFEIVADTEHCLGGLSCQDFHSVCFKQYASYKAYMEKTCGKFIAINWLNHIALGGRWCRLQFLGDHDQVLGTLRGKYYAKTATQK